MKKLLKLLLISLTLISFASLAADKAPVKKDTKPVASKQAKKSKPAKVVKKADAPKDAQEKANKSGKDKFVVK